MPTPPVPTFTLAYHSTQLPPTQVFSFDGAASVTHSDMTDFPISGLTLSLWVKTTQTDDKAVLFTYDQQTDNRRRLYLRNPGSLEVGFGASSTGATGLAINDGRWHQVAITVSPADTTHYRVRIYVDGFLGYQSLSAVSFSAGNGLETGGALVLGQGDSASGEVGFDGAMSELRLWSEVRTADQIVTQMEERLTGSEPGLTLYWALEDRATSGTIVGGGFVDSDLQFRQGALILTVTNFDANGTYTARVEQLDGERSVSTSTFTASPHTISSPTVNRTLSIQLKVTVSGEDSAYSSAQPIVVLNLGPASLQPFSYTKTPEALTAAWSAVDQAPQVQLTLIQDGAPQPPTRQSGTTLDMTPQLTSDSVWGLVVQGVSGAAFGPANTPATLTRPALDFEFVGDGGSSGTLDASWGSIPGAGAYYLELYKRTSISPVTWSKVYSTWTTSTSVSITAAEVPTAEGEVFKARVRPLGGGSVGAWSPEQQVTIVQIARPTLGWSWDGTGHTLAVTWNEVSPGVTYRLRIFEDQNPTPIVDQAGLTARSYDVTTYLSQAHVYTIRVNAVKDGSQGPTNTVVTPPDLAPRFTYDSATSALTVDWTSAPNVYLAVSKQGGAADQQFLAAPTTTYSVPPPSGGFVEGTQYNLAIRGLAQGTLAAPTSASVTIHQLAAPTVAFGYTATPEALTASWDDVRTQAQKDVGLEVTYRVVLTVGGVAQPPVNQSTRSVDMTSYLAMSQTRAVTIQVTGVAQGSVGLPSAIVQPTDLQLALTYDQDTRTLAASWTASVPVYLRAYKQGAEASAVTHYASAGENRFEVPTTGGFQVGDVWICQAKSLPTGSISAPAQAQATVLDLAAPTLTFNNATGLAVTWGDIRTQAQKDAGLTVTYTAFLYRGATLINTTPSIPNTDTGRSYTLDVDWSSTETYTAKLRGVAEGTMGTTSNPPAVGAAVVNAPSFTVSTSTVAASWSAATSATLYHLQLVKVSGGAVVHEETLSATRSSFPIAATSGEELRAQVRALGGGFITTYAVGSSTLTTYPNMVAPLPGTPVIDVVGGTVSMSWSFDESLYPGSSVSYSATLTGAATASQEVSTKLVTFSGLQISAGDAFTVTVQARSGGSQGPTAANQATANAPPKVTGVSASSDTSSVINVRWSSVSVSGATYTVRITGPSSYDRSFPGGSGTSVSLSQSTTGAEGGKVYSVTVAATANSLTGPPSDPASVTVGQDAQVPPDGQPNNPSGGDPINLAAGTFSYDDVGLAFASSTALVFRVHYNTYTPIHAENPFYDGKPMGNRWNHSLNTQLSIDSANKKVYLLWGFGRVDIFTIPASVTGPYTMDGVYNGTALSLGADLVYTVTERDGTRHRFNASGLRTQTISLIGNSVSYSYTDGRLHRATDDASGRWLELSYNTDGRVDGVTDSAGRSISYRYTQGDLTGSTDPLGTTRAYRYWDSQGLGGLSLIKTATDQNGNVFLYNAYTASTDGDKTIYRVTFQQDANAWAAAPAGSQGAYGLSMTYEVVHEDGQDLVKTTFVDAMGFQTVYRSVKANGNMLTEVTTLASGDIRKITHTYDAFNNRLTDTVYEGPANLEPARGGNTVTYTYDGDLNQLTASYPPPIGQARAFTYNDANQVVTDTDHLGNTTVYGYNADGTLQTITDPLGRVTRFTYRAGSVKGLVESITDPLGGVTRYTYQGDLVHTVTTPDGAVTTCVHNNLTQTTSEELRDAQGNLVQTRTYAYNAMDFRTRVAVAFSGQPPAQAYTTIDAPTPINELHERTDALGNKTVFTYLPGLQVYTITYPPASGTQSVTTYGYDRNNHLASERLSPGVVTGYTWDAAGRQISRTDPNGATWTTAYSMVFSGGAAPYPSAVTTTWPPPRTGGASATEVVITDVLGRVVSTTDRAGQTTTLAWTTRADGATRTTQQVLTTTLPQADPGDPATRYTTVQVFDALGRLVSLTSEAGKTSTITYADDTQAHQQVVTSTDPLGNQLILTLDGKQRVIKQVEGKGNTTSQTRYQYDPLDRLTQVVEVTSRGELRTLYTFRYDAASQQVRMSITGPGAAPGHVLSHDALGRVVADTDPAGHALTYAYHPRGLLHTVTRANGTSLTYDFDDAGRFHQLTFTDRSVLTQVLDANGNRTSTTLAGQTVITRTFDAWNRLLTRTDARSAVVGSTWTAVDDLDTLTYPADGGAARTVRYAYDNLRRLQTVTDWAARVIRYGYTPTGQLATATLPNGCATAFRVDDANRFTGLTHTGPAPGGGTQVLSSTSYTLDALGQLTGADELLTIAPQNPVGRTSLVYNGASELTAIDGQALTYDDAGNTTSLPGVATLEHDDYNLLTRYGADRYSYDADALRDTATVGGATTRYLHFPDAYQAPWLEQGDPSRAIVRATTVRDLAGAAGLSPTAVDTEPLPFARSLPRLLQTTNDQGQVLARFIHGVGLAAHEAADGSYRVYLFDPNGNTVALTDGQGQMIGRFAYTPFGGLAAQDGELPPFLFNGRDGVLTDANGLCDMRARRYRPAQLRFLERDFLLGDLGVPQSINPYAYVIGDPMQFVDPLGLSHSTGWWVGVGIGIGAGVGAVIGGIVGGISGGLSGGVAGAIGGALGGAVGGAIGGGVGGALGGAVGGGIGAGAGGGLTGGLSATRIGSGVARAAYYLGRSRSIRALSQLGKFLRGTPRGYASAATEGIELAEF